MRQCAICGTPMFAIRHHKPALHSQPQGEWPELGFQFQTYSQPSCLAISKNIIYSCATYCSSEKVMKVVTYSHARNSLKSVLDDVVQDADVTIISRRDAEGDAVVMSLDSYNSIMETLHLTSNPANSAALAKAIAQDKAGQAQKRQLLAVE